MPNELASNLRRSRQEPPAFGEVYAVMAPKLLTFFTRRTFDVEAAADLTAETFACGFEGRRRFRGTSDAEAAGWLYGIAQHQFSRYVRRGIVERKAIERLGIQVPALADDDYEQITEMAGLSEMREQVAAAFSALPSEQRDALRLRVVEDCSYPDVAATLGVSEPAARARVSRALRRLADAAELSIPTEVTP
jgi:RNA polymerase sigma factor (sigma-70 family)